MKLREMRDQQGELVSETLVTAIYTQQEIWDIFGELELDLDTVLYGLDDFVMSLAINESPDAELLSDYVDRFYERFGDLEVGSE